MAKNSQPAAKRRGEKAWWNGNITAVRDIHLSPFVHALHYGTGAFEGVRAYKQSSGGGAIFRLREHMERWISSFQIMGFALPYERSALEQACLDACKANQFEECYIRPLAFIGDGPLGVFPGENPPIDVCVLTWEWGSYLGHAGSEQAGARLRVSSYIRPHVNSIMTKGKISGQYVTGVLAKCEAKRDGYDEALLLDPEGYLAEGSGENLFIIKDGVVKTAPLNSLLNGITRHSVLEYFKAHQIPLVTERFTRDELYSADECFLTGTAAEVTPVVEVDGRPIGARLGQRTTKPGPVTTQLKKDFDLMVRGKPFEFSRNWLTPIR